jgi:predicted ArsR family transcriptional regulator
MAEPRSTDIDPIASLAEPVRRRLYEFVVASGGPVDRDAAAEGVGVGRPLAAFHLDRLAQVGLLDVEYRRRSGRTGPGAGRPAKFYRRPTGRDVSLSLPPRHYDLAAEILAEGIERQAGAASGVLAAARDRGTALAQALEGAPGGPDGLLSLLAVNGYEPFVDGDGTIRLGNCPFHALVDEHRELTCSMNLALLSAAAEGVEGLGLEATAQPREGFCCVAFVPRDRPDAARRGT